MVLELSALKPEDGPKLGHLWAEALKNDPLFASLTEAMEMEKGRADINEKRTDSLQRSLTDSSVVELCMRDTETGDIAAEATYHIEPSHESDFEEWKQYKKKDPGPGWNTEAYHSLMSIEHEKRVEFVGAKPHIYILRLRTDPKYQRRGAATTLMKQAIADAEARKIPIYLTSSPNGHLLYSKLGFETLETFPKDGSPELRAYCCIYNPKSASTPAAATAKKSPPAAATQSSVVIEPMPFTTKDMMDVPRILDSAFGPSQFMRLLFANEERKPSHEEQAATEASMASAAPDAYKWSLARDTATGEVLGVAKWYVAHDPAAVHFPNGDMEVLRPQVNRALLERTWNEGARWRHAYFKDKGKPYAYMALLAVDARAQRRGVGGKLLAEGLDWVDANGWECWIDGSPAGVGLYRKWGWEDYGSLETDLREYGGSTSHRGVCLIRQPGAKRPA